VSTKFDSDVQSKVYGMMIANLDAVLAHPYHGPGLKQTISCWARTSRYVASYKFNKDWLFFSSRGGLFEPEKAGPSHIFVHLSVIWSYIFIPPLGLIHRPVLPALLVPISANHYPYPIAHYLLLIIPHSLSLTHHSLPFICHLLILNHPCCLAF
jgi:hypothetical protein